MNKKLSLTTLLAIGLGILVLLSACTGASTSTSTTSTSTTTSTGTTQQQYTINVSTSPTLGQYLVDSNGMTLYWTTADSSGVSNVTGSNLSIWPVFYTASISVPPSLNASDFGSITRADGSMQTTYKTWPLYYFHDDTAAGQTNGQGVIGRWSVVDPSASGPQPVTTSSTSSTTSTSTTSTTQP